MNNASIITLLTDFGLRDTYVAELKGVILALSPHVVIVDLSHEVIPGGIREASFLLSCSYRYFKPETIHCVVVDPGVGTSRDIIVVRTNHYYFVAPDNGVLYEAVKKDGGGKIYKIDIEAVRHYLGWGKEVEGTSVISYDFKLPPSSKTFHGRDIFAPVLSLLASGYSPALFSTKCSKMEELKLPKPVKKQNTVHGIVLYIDHFGNAITNITPNLIKKEDELFLVNDDGPVSIGKVRETYADVDIGSPLALLDSRGFIEIAVNGASAADKLGIRIGQEVLIKEKGLVNKN